MNKFIFIKARSRNGLLATIAKVEQRAVDALSFHPSDEYLFDLEDTNAALLGWSIANTGSFQKGYVHHTDRSVIVLDGLPLHSRLHYDQRLACSFDEQWGDSRTLQQRISGSWAAGRAGANGIEFIQDFSGTSPLFWLSTPELMLLSNRLDLLGLATDTRLENPAAWAALLAQSNLLARTSLPLLGAELLSPSMMLEVSTEPNSTEFTLQPLPKPWDCYGVETHRLSIPGIDDVIHSLLNTFGEVARLPLGNIQMDITAGLDSRLMAILATHSALKDNITQLQTRGCTGDTDVDIGARVAQRLGIPHVILEPSQRSFDLSKVEERLSHHLHRFEGMIAPPDGLIDPSRDTRLALSGGGGEVARRHAKPHLDLRVENIDHLEQIFCSYHQPLDPLGVLHADVAREVSQQIASEALKLARAGFPLNDISDLFYFEFRLPLWNGVLHNNIYGQLRVCPLLNLDLASLGASLGFEARVQDQLHHLIMHRIDPATAEIERVGPVWDPILPDVTAHSNIRKPVKNSASGMDPALVAVANSDHSHLSDALDDLHDQPLGGLIDVTKARSALSALSNRSPIPALKQALTLYSLCTAAKGGARVRKEGQAMRLRSKRATINLDFSAR